MNGKGALMPGVHELKLVEDAVAYRIHRTNRLLLTHLSRVLDFRDHNLTPEKWLLLARIHQHAPVRQVELSDTALEDAPNVSRLVDSLVSAGLVEREVDPEDRRGRILTLTTEGNALCQDLLSQAVAERQRVFEGFSERELAALTDALDRLEANTRKLLRNDDNT